MKKVLSDKKLTKRLDETTSEIVRREASDWRGYASCVTCGVTLPWKELQNGHYVSRIHYALRWSFFNCHVQCYRCNVLLKGNMSAYALFMLKKIGRKGLEMLEGMRHVHSPTRKEKLSLLEQYEARLKQLRDKENIAVPGTKGGSGSNSWEV